MTDIEKVIKGLETCRTRVNCKECPYAYDKRANDSCCEAVLHNDVLELLKEKEAEVEIEGGGSTWFYVCGECHTSISPYAKYCRECGRRLNWDVPNSMQT